MLIHQHRRQSLWNNLVVPTLPVSIERSHPLGAGLVGCYIPGGYHEYGDISGIGPTLEPDSSTGILSLFNEGYGYDSSSTGSSLFSSTFPDQWKIATGGTLFWRGFIYSIAINSANIVLWGNIQSNAQEPPNSCYSIVISATTGAFGFSYSVVSTSAVVDTGVFPGFTNATIAVSFTVGGAINIHIWNPSYSLTTGTWSGDAPDYTLSPNPCIGVDPVMDATDFSETATMAAYLYDYPLSAGQIAWLNAEPYSMLHPSARTLRNSPSTSGNPFRRWNRTYLIR